MQVRASSHLPCGLAKATLPQESMLIDLWHAEKICEAIEAERTCSRN
jgi:hypothetical protein